MANKCNCFTSYSHNLGRVFFRFPVIILNNHFSWHFYSGTIEIGACLKDSRSTDHKHQHERATLSLNDRRLSQRRSLHFLSLIVSDSRFAARNVYTEETGRRLHSHPRVPQDDQLSLRPRTVGAQSRILESLSCCDCESLFQLFLFRFPRLWGAGGRSGPSRPPPRPTSCSA